MASGGADWQTVSHGTQHWRRSAPMAEPCDDERAKPGKNEAPGSGTSSSAGRLRDGPAGSALPRGAQKLPDERPRHEPIPD